MGRASSVGFVCDRSDLPRILYPLEIEGRRKKEERRRKKEEGRRKKEEGRSNVPPLGHSPPRTLPQSPTLSFYSLDWCGPNSFKSPNYCLGTDWRFRYAISRLYVFGTTGLFSWLHSRRTERTSRIFHCFRFAISQ